MTWRSFIVTMVVVSLAPLVGAEVGRSSDTKKAVKLCNDAGDALKNGRIEDGRALLQKALILAPDLPDAHVGLGQIAMAEKRYEAALEEFERAEAGYRVYVNELIERAQKNENAKNDEMMRLSDSMSQLSVSGAKSRTAPMDYAKLANQAQRLASSDGPLPSSHDLSEPLGQIFYFTGNALFRLGRLPEAVEYYKASAELSPRNLPTYTNLAIVYWKTGQTEDALATLARAEGQGLQVDPKLKSDLAATKAAPLVGGSASAPLATEGFEREIANAVQLTAAMTPPERIKKVDPIYPEAARLSRVEGRVVLEAVIDENGNVSAARAVSGDPSLAKASIYAVLQWRYRPAQAEGKPVKIRMMVQMDFALAKP